MDWHVNFEWQTSASLNEDALDEFMSRLADLSPALSRSKSVLGMSIAVTAPDAESAIGIGLRHARGALGALDLEAVLTHIGTDTTEAVVARLREGAIPRLVGVKEVAGLLGVSPQRASELAKSVSFPRPVTKLASGPVWLEASIQHFASDWKRLPGRRAAARV